MSFCTVKPEHLTWTVRMTAAMMRENISPENIIRDIANKLPSNNMFMKATLVSKIPQYIQSIMAESTVLSRAYLDKYGSILDLRESFESEKGYANVLEFVNEVTLADKVDATIAAIEDEKVEEELTPTEEVEPTKPETPTTERYSDIQNLDPQGNEEFRKSFVMKTRRGDTIEAEIVKYPGKDIQVVKVGGFGPLGQYDVDSEVKKRYKGLENGSVFKFVSQEEKSARLAKKINAGSGKSVTRMSKLVREASALEPYSPRDEAMLYFIRGGKVHESVIDRLLNGSSEEKRAKSSLLTKEEKARPKAGSDPIELVAHALYENTEFRDSEDSALTSDQDYRSEVEEVFTTFNNREQMAKALLESRKGMNEQIAPEGYEDFSEQEDPEAFPEEYVAFRVNEIEMAEKGLAASEEISVKIGHGIEITNTIQKDEKSEQDQKAQKAETGSSEKAGKRVIQDFGKSIRPSFRDAVPDRLKGQLTDHQQTGVNAIVQAVQEKKHFLLADGAGAGKTRILLTAAQALKNSGKRVIIITENKEIIAGSFKNDSKTLGMPFKQDKIGNAESDGTRVVTMNAFKDISKVDPSQYDVLIVDESQKASGLTSQISEKVKSFKGQIVYSSATPFDTEEKTIYILPKLFGISEEDYISEIGGRIQKVPRREAPELLFPNGKTKFNAVMNSAHQRLISAGKMLHRRYEFFGNDDLNIDTIGNSDEFGGGYSIEQVEEGISFLAREKVKKAYLTDRDIRDRVSIEDKKREINTQKANALKRVPESFKANTQLINQIAQDLKDGKQVILYSINVEKKGLSFEIMTPDGEVKKINRPVFIEQMKKKLGDKGIEFGVITGAEKNRAASVDRFQNGDLKVLLINESGTTGINLNDTFGNAPRKLYIAGALPNAIQLEQVKGRVSRINNASPAEVVYVSVNSNAEVKNREKLLGKVAILNSILTGQQLDAAVESQEAKVRIEQEVAETPKGPFIEQEPGDSKFTVKNSFVIKNALKNMGGEYRRGYSGWKFDMSRRDEVQNYLNSIAPKTIAPELQIKKIDGEIAAEEALAKAEQPGVSQTQAPIDPETIKSIKDLLRPNDENLRRADDQKNEPC